jgi:hypothetical protein
MILYVNGCSHSAADEAAVNFSWACDDPDLWQAGTEAHPANLAVSYGKHIADALDAKLVCHASSGGSNPRVIRTTREWIANNPDKLADTLMILQWTTWEREEWFYQDRWYQVNASGIDHVPDALQDRYKQYVINVDWEAKTNQAHEAIWDFHCELKAQGIKHLFFSGHSTFSHIKDHVRRDWGVEYMHPYVWEESYHNWLINNGGSYANPDINHKSYHFDAKSHRLWAKYVLQYMLNNQIVSADEIPTD